MVCGHIIGLLHIIGRALVVYFSCTNTTKGVAEKIADVVSADIYGIKAKEPYTAADLDYSPSRSATEQSNPSARPAIAGGINSIDSYSMIYLGYPIWLAYYNLIQCTQA